MKIGTRVTSPGGTFEAAILVGRAFQPLYRHNGKIWVAGVAGEAYVIQVKNLLTGRLELVSSVDGRDTLTDKPAGLSSTGMVFPGNRTGTFDGFRHNDDEVGEFVFCDPSAAVAAQAGAPENIGVIGLAAYRERTYQPRPVIHSHGPGYGHDHSHGDTDWGHEYFGGVTMRSGGSKGMSMGAGGGGLKSFNSSAGGDASMTYDSAPAAVASPGLGTGIGQTIASHVDRTRFTREGGPDSLTIRYDTEANLRERGILTDQSEPQAFPASGGYGSYSPVR